MSSTTHPDLLEVLQQATPSRFPHLKDLTLEGSRVSVTVVNHRPPFISPREQRSSTEEISVAINIDSEEPQVVIVPASASEARDNSKICLISFPDWREELHLGDGTSKKYRRRVVWAFQYVPRDTAQRSSIASTLTPLAQFCFRPTRPEQGAARRSKLCDWRLAKEAHQNFWYLSTVARQHAYGLDRDGPSLGKLGGQGGNIVTPYAPIDRMLDALSEMLRNSNGGNFDRFIQPLMLARSPSAKLALTVRILIEEFTR